MNANFLQKLTGKTAEDIETEMGYPSTRDGGGVPIQVPKIFVFFASPLVLRWIDPQLCALCLRVYKINILMLDILMVSLINAV